MKVPHLLQILAIICPLTFLAGFIDSIAGGGGLISLPAYLFIGLPSHQAIATNKLSSTFGTLLSVVRFAKSGKLHLQSSLISIAGALPGSLIGASLVLIIDERYLKYLLIILLPIIVAVVFMKKDFGQIDKPVIKHKMRTAILSFVAGFITGIYDGFFGPGTGTFLILIYTGIIGFNLSTASGNAKIVNLASNVAALVTFVMSGKVLFAVGLPAAFFCMLGNWIGSNFAIKKGAKIIKPVFIIVVILLFIKIVIDIIK